MFSIAAYGSKDSKQKRAYKWIAILIWVLLLILGNTVL
jgi:hypothetical protein